MTALAQFSCGAVENDRNSRIPIWMLTPSLFQYQAAKTARRYGVPTPTDLRARRLGGT